MKNNIESFNIAVAEIFGRCYQSFPVPTNISIIDIGDAIKKPEDNDIDLRSEEYKIAKASLNWLSEAGYIWHGTATNMEVHSVVLSPKGLEVMNAVPSELKSSKTLGEQLSMGVKAIGREAATTAVKASLTYGAKLVLGA